MTAYDYSTAILIYRSAHLDMRRLVPCLECGRTGHVWRGGRLTVCERCYRGTVASRRRDCG